MLRILREHATSWMLRGLLILVAVTFISWGGYSLIREKRQTYAAKVNDRTIELREYDNAYQTLIKQYRDAFGPAFSDKMVAELRLGERLLEDLISRILIVEEARRLGFEINNDELKEMIQSVPGFQTNGQFDPRMYQRFLNLSRITPEQFEQMERERFLASKLVNLVRENGGKVSQEEVFDVYLFENERISLNFIKVAPPSFKGQVAAKEEEIKDYYQKHQEEFRVPTFIQIQYLAFRPSDYEANVQVSPEEVKRFYEARKDRFKTPRQLRVREILLKAGPQDPPEKMEEKRKKAEEILEKARKTKDFASLAKQYSESDTASRGGDRGWVQKGMIGEPAESALFSLKPGELSAVLQGPNGFTIFRVEEIRDERERSLEETRVEILQALKKEKGKAEASRKADDAFYTLFRSRDLEKYAQEKNVPIKTTGFFKEGDEVPEIGRDPSFYSSALSLKTGEISSVLSIPPNFYLLKMVNKKDSRIPPLDEVKQEVGQKVIGNKSDEKARQVADDLLNQVRGGKPIRDVARENGLPLEETGFFTRTSGVVPKIGPAGEFGAALSSLTEKNPYPKEPLRTKDGYFVVKLAGLEPAEQAKFESVKKDLQKRLALQKQEEFFQNWIAQLRSKAKIDINRDLLKSS